ncbi:16S rRNA (guanine(527)-N(7))-methyltransferase RsmG [Aliidiomarina haloalkalitolerans]|uniref:Ribosomal RNA small subunit methyltransferase G n=1 Tax=Aliidiomarina haloalkalitolerans TaxID=859059 RepID=A0A432VS40_9GAMM|nr:16S rRNA (guanine(527)-N(7))-methyltransferase RsmG [Aliidiomarina haloalkalitolerans]RUO19148.1 16S rRNA (guanine(527)-N(7))-methyltransferase RsmG [Aliidiomarina haloalkalitolerans]
MSKATPFPTEQLAARLSQLLKETDLSVSDEQQQQLIALLGMLHKWNKAYNLTSVRDPAEMLIRHILDSIVVSPYLHGKTVIDVGTGPGLPGLPLAICNPDREFVLLDSLGKRISFIRQVVHELKLTNVTPVLARVQDYDSKNGFDSVVSRAFASLADMLSWCHHLPSADGRFIALKGLATEEELAAVEPPYRILAVHQLQVPTLEAARHVVEIITD